MTPKLTGPQRRALIYLSEADYATPALVGIAASGEYRQDCADYRPIPRSRQRSAQIGSAIANRLEKRGLVQRKIVHDWDYWQITRKGREALRD